jgi:hypothetical protein
MKMRTIRIWTNRLPFLACQCAPLSQARMPAMIGCGDDP